MLFESLYGKLRSPVDLAPISFIREIIVSQLRLSTPGSVPSKRRGSMAKEETWTSTIIQFIPNELSQFQFEAY